MLKNKKMLIIISVVILILILVILGFIFKPFGNISDETPKKANLDVVYDKNEVISYDNFKKSFEAKKTIKIKNVSDKDITFDIKWFEVTNTLKKQKDFLYKIDCSGKNCVTLGDTQMPAKDVPVLAMLKIAPKEEQVYIVMVNYKGLGETAKFSGKLKPVEVKTEKEKSSKKDKQ